MALFPSKFHRDLVLTQLRTLGASQVVVEFSGGGDSGDIQPPYCVDANKQRIKLPETKFEWPRERTVLRDDKWERQGYTEMRTLSEILHALTNDALEQQNIDWYNNDGGQGRLTIDFTQSPPEIDLEVGINYTSTEDHEFNFSDEEYD